MLVGALGQDCSQIGVFTWIDVQGLLDFGQVYSEPCGGCPLWLYQIIRYRYMQAAS